VVSIVQTKGNSPGNGQVNLVAPRFRKEERKIQDLVMDQIRKVEGPVKQIDRK
jgi:hypothetical protein